MKLLVTELKKLKVIQKGEFKLKSGETSYYYVDMKKAFGLPKAFRLTTNELCKVVDRRATCIAGSGHGGLPLATAVSIKLGLPLVLIRDKIKKHGIQKMIDGYIPTKKDRVAIIDDVFTIGTCISNIINVLEKANVKNITGYVAINRGDISKFKIPIKSLLTSKELTS